MNCFSCSSGVFGQDRRLLREVDAGQILTATPPAAAAARGHPVPAPVSAALSSRSLAGRSRRLRDGCETGGDQYRGEHPNQPQRSTVACVRSCRHTVPFRSSSAGYNPAVPRIENHVSHERLAFVRSRQRSHSRFQRRARCKRHAGDSYKRQSRSTRRLRSPCRPPALRHRIRRRCRARRELSGVALPGVPRSVQRQGPDRLGRSPRRRRARGRSAAACWCAPAVPTA